MRDVSIAKMSSKGQIVIPQKIREDMQLKEGEAFGVVWKGDTMVLTKVKAPSREEMLRRLEKMLEEGQKTVKKLGIKESDVLKIIHRRRGVKYD